MLGSSQKLGCGDFQTLHNCWLWGQRLAAPRRPKQSVSKEKGNQAKMTADRWMQRLSMMPRTSINASSFSFCGRFSSCWRPGYYRPNSDNAARPFSPNVWQRLCARAKAFAIPCPLFFADWLFSRVACGPSSILRLGCCRESLTNGLVNDS